MAKLEASAHWAQIVQAAAALLALGAAAWWFRQQREVYPRGELTQSVEVFRLEPGIAAVEVHVHFENAGKRLIELSSATVRLQHVGSEPYEIADLAAVQETGYWQAMRPTGSDKEDRHFSQGELRWPVLKKYQAKIEHRVEPGETDLLVFSFVVPCRAEFGSKPRLSDIRIASDIYKPATDEEEGYAWKARSFADLSRVCQ